MQSAFSEARVLQNLIQNRMQKDANDTASISTSSSSSFHSIASPSSAELVTDLLRQLSNVVEYGGTSTVSME